MIALTIGFTGTQNGMNRFQLEDLENYLRKAYDWALRNNRRAIFRHGDCIGADKQAAETARFIGYYVIAHPSNLRSKRAYYPFNNETLEEKFPLDRNKDIVALSDHIVATPKEEITDPEPLRSGTWMTIRYARSCNKNLLILYA
jgi:hypothetical protein